MSSLLAQRKASSDQRKELKQREEFAVRKTELEAKWKARFDYEIDEVWGDTTNDILYVQLHKDKIAPEGTYQSYCIYEIIMRVDDNEFPDQLLKWFQEYAKSRDDICYKMMYDEDYAVVTSRYHLRMKRRTGYPSGIEITLKKEEDVVVADGDA